MKLNLKKLVFKFSLTLFLLSLVMFFWVDKGTAESYVSLFSAIINFIFCTALAIMIKRSEKK